MADEAIIVELLGNGGDPIEYSIDDDTALEKGTLMKLSTATERKAVKSSSVTPGTPIGITAYEKVADDGSETIALYTNGIFDLTVDDAGAVTAGEFVIYAGANTITRQATTGLEPDDNKIVLGVALGDGAAGEVIQVRVNL